MKDNNKFIPPNIHRNDVILPLFTEKLRSHLKKKLHEESKIAHEKMIKDGWGKTRFGEPNPEYYKNYTHTFFNRFNKYLNMKTFEVYEREKFNGNLYMRCGDVINGEFEVYPLDEDKDYHVSRYFRGFKFKISNYGKDFYKIGHS